MNCYFVDVKMIYWELLFEVAPPLIYLGYKNIAILIVIT